jgi:hypothetical protein
MDRILAGAPERSNGALTIVALAIEAGVPRNALAQRGHAKAADAAAGAPAWPLIQVPGGAVLNAESELSRAHGEITARCGWIGELLGRIRDLEHDLPEDGVARTITENRALRAQVRQLTQDNRRLEERLAGARDTNRFFDKRIAELEAELVRWPHTFTGC